MNKISSSLLLSLVSVLLAGNALAQSSVGSANSSGVVQVAVVNPVAPVMTHDIATMIKLSHQAQAQYRRSGSSQDLARVNVMRSELASRGFGRATLSAPVMSVETQLASNLSGENQVLVSAAQ